MAISSVTLARNIQLPDDGLRTETCGSSFSVLMCKFYISALVGIIIEWQNVLFYALSLRLIWFCGDGMSDVLFWQYQIQHNIGCQIVFGKFCKIFFICLSKRCANTDNCTFRIKETVLNLLAPELFFLILVHPVYKMWIIQEPNTLELWNKLHFEEKETESIYYV